MKIYKLPIVYRNDSFTKRLCFYLVQEGEKIFAISENSDRGGPGKMSDADHRDAKKEYWYDLGNPALEEVPEGSHLYTPELLEYIEWVKAGKSGVSFHSFDRSLLG